MESSTRVVVSLLCAQDKEESVALEWFMAPAWRGKATVTRECWCGHQDQTVIQAVEARIGGDGNLEFFDECLY